MVGDYVVMVHGAELQARPEGGIGRGSGL